MTDRYELERFVDAQDRPDAFGRIYDQALKELRAGHRAGHWMWFIFPQIEGPGTSTTSRKFAVSSFAGARAYMDHSVLGPRLVESTVALNDLRGHDATRVLGTTDAMKLRSSMTLFSLAASDGEPFRAALEKYFEGRPDRRTLEILESEG